MSRELLNRMPLDGKRQRYLYKELASLSGEPGGQGNNRDNEIRRTKSDSAANLITVIVWIA